MARRAFLGALTGALLGAVAARAAYAAFTRRPPAGDAETWARTNHRGEPITLLEGPAFVAGAGAAAAVIPGLPARVRAAALLAAAGGGGLGAYDDLYGATSSKGFKGHLSALAKGEVTSGAVKILGIGATGLAAAAVTSRAPLDVAVNGALIAGSANLANLFDLRPGRAIKVGLLTGRPCSPRACSGTTRSRPPWPRSPWAPPSRCCPRTSASGRCSATPGPTRWARLLGLAAALTLGRPGRLAVLGTVVALTAASEKVSFTKVIAGNPVLNRVDMLGRRPVEQAPATR